MCNPKQFLFFQSTLLQEERHLCGNRISRFLFFQSTLLQEERPYLPCLFATGHVFQSTLLQEERRDNTAPYCRFKTFNPRSYKRSDLMQKRNPILQKLSIHAPTRGATFLYNHHINVNKTFNPRSYKRSDISICILIHATLIFQSTLLQEERLHTDNTYRCIILLSIHAPTRGATKRCPCEYAVF